MPARYPQSSPPWDDSGSPAEHERESADAARGTKADRAKFASCLFQRATDSRNLYIALDHLGCKGGEAPGPDGLRPGDLSAAERWSLSRALETSRRSGSYQPGPHREIKVPKGGDRGTRTLQIQDVGDRVWSDAASRLFNHSWTRVSRRGRLAVSVP